MYQQQLYDEIVVTLGKIEGLPAQSGFTFEQLKAVLDAAVLGLIYPGRNEIAQDWIDKLAQAGIVITLTPNWAKYEIRTSNVLISYA